MANHTSISACFAPGGFVASLVGQRNGTQLGLNRPQIAAAVGNVVARMALPCSELAALKEQPALGELRDALSGPDGHATWPTPTSRT